jgi:Na+-driven multidrug efflux pump
MVPEPINVTSLVDPSALDVIDWVDAAEVAAHVTEPQRPIEDFLPKELPIVEEDVMVIQSPEDSSALFAPGEPAPYPSMAKIIKFSLPAIGVWLCSPVLSMIDTASVGLLAGTAQQAALNPAVSVTDYGALLVAFMYTATTNLIAGAQEKDKLGQNLNGGEGQVNQPRTTKTLVTALRLALLVGVTFGAVLGTAAPFLLKMLIGNSSLDPTVFQSALRYVQIRSLGMPAAVVIGTAQSACLGMQDVKSPLYVLAAAAGINLLGDMVLVRNASPWLGGAAGAAWATVLSQYGALIMFLRWLTLKNKKQNGSGNSVDTLDPMAMIKDTSKDVGKSVKVTFGNAFQKGTSIRKKLFSSTESKAVEEEEEKNDGAPAKGFLSGSHNPISILNPLRLGKSKSTIQKFLPFVIPVTTTSIGRVSGYLTMSHVASSAFGTLDMAAHQIAISIFCCLAPVVDALNQVAQSFVPGIFARKKGRARANALRNTSLNFAKVGALFGSTLVAGVALGVPALAPWFTSDPAVIARVRNAIPGLAIFLGFDGLMCIGEGTLLGQNDLKFLRNCYASFFFIVPAFMLRLKRRALSGIEVGIGTMWGTFSAYEVVRTVMWLARMAWLQFKMDKEADDMEAARVAP